MIKLQEKPKRGNKKDEFQLYAAAAKSLQSCLTLCDPIGGSPPRLPNPWDSPGKNTGVGCHFLLQCMKVKSESEVTQSDTTLATPWSAAYQAPLPMGFSRQKYWSGVPFLLRTIPKTNIFFSFLFFLSHVSLTISELVSKLFTGYMSSM